MSAFSVKKPLTIFVAVIAVIVLGIVAFTNMTPDLLPNLDMPYVLVITPYPGSTPEKTEMSVTKPLEQSMASLENIVNIDSTSGENSSTIILEFSEDVNMDTVTVDILQAVQQVEGGWDEMVGTPIIMKINPSMLPVMVAAVEMEDMDTVELSNLMKNELQTKLEGIDGVASVQTSGMIEETVKVVLSATRLEELNRKIEKAIDGEFEEPEKELADAQAELDKQGGLSIGGGSMDDIISQGDLDRLTGLPDELSAEAQKALDEQTDALEKQLKDLRAQLKELKAAEAQMKQLYDMVVQATEAYEAAEARYNTLIDLRAQLKDLNDQWDALVAAVAADGTNGEPAFAGWSEADQKDWLNDPAHAPYYATYVQWVADNAILDTRLAASGTSRATLEADLAQATIDYQMAQQVLAGVEGMLASFDPPMTIQDVLDGYAQLQQGITMLESGIQSLQQMLDLLKAGEIGLEEAEKQLEGLSFEMPDLGFDLGGLGDMANAMIDGQLESARAQIESGLEQLEKARENAKKQANLNNVLTLDTLSQILTAQNFAMPVGYVDDGGVDVMVSVGDEVKSVEELQELILIDLQMDGLDPIYLGDVADVYMDDDREDVYAKINGNDGVLLTFSKQSTYATAVVSDNITARFEKLSEEYPGLHFYSMMDQGDYIYLVVNSILENLLWGALFAIIVLFLFLRDIRPTVITLVSIPISVVFAIALMYFSGVTINIISLSGLAVAVGMLVDNSVVVIENVFRLRSLGYSPVKAAVSGATQVSGAIIASTLTTVCVFLPIVFIEGLTRQLFTDLALTLGYSLVASLIVALTLVPAMSSAMMKGYKEKESRLMGRMLAVYQKTLGWTLNHKAIIMLASLALLVLSFMGVVSRGFSFMPSMEMPQMTVSIAMDEEATREEAIAVTDETLARLEGIEGVDTTGAMLSSGGGMMGSLMGGGGGQGASVYVMLKEDNRRSAAEIGDEIEAVTADLDAEISASASSGVSLDMLAGSGVSVDLYGNDMDELQATAKDIAKTLEALEGVGEANDGIGETSPEMRFIVNREKAMEEGLTTAQVYMEITKALATEKSATSILQQNNEYDVIIISGNQDEVTPDYLRNYSFTVTDKEGEDREVWLRNIAEIEDTESKTSISRHNQRRRLTITATIAEGHNVSLVAGDISEAMDGYPLPAGMSVEYSGENESIMEAFEQLLLMLLLGVLLVYLIMVAQFQSLKSPFIVMFTIPLAFTGGLLALLVTGMELSVISLIGFVMLVGIVVNNGIVLVDYINQLRREGKERREAISEAGVTRMRPILMTSITTILGLSVMALGVGMGSDLMQPIAITCIGGMLYATLMTLYVVPVMYDLFNKKELRVVDEEDLEIIDE